MNNIEQVPTTVEMYNWKYSSNWKIKKIKLKEIQERWMQMK